MRWRVFLGLSLIANLILAMGWLAARRPTPASEVPLAEAADSITATNTKIAVIVRRQFFSWQELESQDYPTYIKNLRAIGCPEQTIRDIIIADVTQMLREKYPWQLTRLIPNPKWWTNHRDPNTEADDGPQNMWAERAAILTQLLGPDWDKRPQAAANSPLNRILATLELNPILQGLPADKKQLLTAVLSQSPTWDGGLGTGLIHGLRDPAKAAAAEKARWDKLAEALSLDQLEAAKLHFSAHAEELREELDALPGFDTQPEEFRQIFRNTEAIEAQLAALTGRDDEAANQQRAALNAQREAAIRNSLSPQRYELYARLSDPAYLNVLETLGDAKATPESIALLYAINREHDAEQERIENDPNLTDTQREIELKRLELEQLKAAALVRGEELPDEPSQQPTPRPEPMKSHNVRPGEGLEQIASVYGISPETLRTANPTLNFDKLPAGTKVNVPLRYVYPLPPP